MRKILSLFILLFFVTNVTYAFKNEPSGFRSLNWGASVSDFINEYPNAELLTQTFPEKSLEEISYEVRLQDSTISNNKINGPVKFSFWKNKLISVDIPLSGASVSETLFNTDKMLSALNILYGDSTSSFQEGSIFDKGKSYIKYYEWDGYITKIVLFADFYEKNIYDSYCNLYLYSSALINERMYEHQQKVQDDLKQGW